MPVGFEKYASLKIINKYMKPFIEHSNIVSYERVANLYMEELSSYGVIYELQKKRRWFDTKLNEYLEMNYRGSTEFSEDHYAYWEDAKNENDKLLDEKLKESMENDSKMKEEMAIAQKIFDKVEVRNRSEKPDVTTLEEKLSLQIGRSKLVETLLNATSDIFKYEKQLLERKFERAEALMANERVSYSDESKRYKNLEANDSIMNTMKDFLAETVEKAELSSPHNTLNPIKKVKYTLKQKKTNKTFEYNFNYLRDVREALFKKEAGELKVDEQAELSRSSEIADRLSKDKLKMSDCLLKARNEIILIKEPTYIKTEVPDFLEKNARKVKAIHIDEMEEKEEEEEQNLK